jgi:hypothetical protein
LISSFQKLRSNPLFERLYQAEGRHKAGKMSLHPHTLQDLNEKAASSCRLHFPPYASARGLSRFHISESDNTVNAIQFTVIEVEERREKLFPPVAFSHLNFIKTREHFSAERTGGKSERRGKQENVSEKGGKNELKPRKHIRSR